MFVVSRYLAKHHDDLATTQEKKKVLAKLNELIEEELEAAGLTFGGITIIIVTGLVCVLLVLGMVLTAQHLFYANRGGGPGGRPRCPFCYSDRVRAISDCSTQCCAMC